MKATLSCGLINKSVGYWQPIQDAPDVLKIRGDDVADRRTLRLFSICKRTSDNWSYGYGHQRARDNLFSFFQRKVNASEPEGCSSPDASSVLDTMMYLDAFTNYSAWRSEGSIWINKWGKISWNSNLAGTARPVSSNPVWFSASSWLQAANDYRLDL